MWSPRRVGKLVLLLAVAPGFSGSAKAQPLRIQGDVYDPYGYQGYYGDLGYRDVYRGPGFYRFVPPGIENPKVIVPGRQVAANGQQPSVASRASEESLETLLEKAEILFGDPDNIYRSARETRDLVRKKGQVADATQIIAGAIYLAEHPRNPTAQRQGVTKPRFADYCNQYLDWRCKGKSHQEAIARIDGLVRY
jgi:hypothetical protein